MSPAALRELFERVRRNELSVDDAVECLATLPFEDLGFARVDHHRELRTGFPEVIFGQGKSPVHLVAIARRILARKRPLLATRLDEIAARRLMRLTRRAEWNATARTVYVPPPGRRAPPQGSILVICAGTSDLSVAEEAVVTCRAMGGNVTLLSDVGVAGLHRLLAEVDTLRAARVIVVVAGMEGALPSVVGGLVAVPVIAVPTSVGYGASFGGLAALLAMLNSCASGVTVVNIDNGFGAGYAASLINR